MKANSKWYWDGRLDMLSGRGFAAVFATVVIVLVALGAVVGERSNYITARVEIEQLRIDASAVSETMGDHVQGQVAQWNQTIRSKQRWNRIAVIGWFIPNGWDRIQPINIR